MFGVTSTKRGKKLESVIHYLRTIFANIQIQEKKSKSQQNIEELKNQFIKLVEFRLENELKLLKISAQNSQAITSKIINILNYFVSSSLNFSWELFDIKVEELEQEGNSLGFTFHLGSDLKSIFLIQNDSSEMEEIMTLLFQNIEHLSRELSSQIQESNNKHVDFFMKRIRDELTHVFHLAIRSIETENSLKNEIPHIYTYLDIISDTFRHIHELNEDDIDEFKSLGDEIDDFFNKFGGVVVGKVSVGFIVRDCCFEHLLDINKVLQKTKNE